MTFYPQKSAELQEWCGEHLEAEYLIDTQHLGIILARR